MLWSQYPLCERGSVLSAITFCKFGENECCNLLRICLVCGLAATQCQATCCAWTYLLSDPSPKSMLLVPAYSNRIWSNALTNILVIFLVNFLAVFVYVLWMCFKCLFFFFVLVVYLHLFSVAQALHQPSHTRHSHHVGSGVGCVMYILEGTKRSSGPAGNFARNGRLTV